MGELECTYRVAPQIAVRLQAPVAVHALARPHVFGEADGPAQASVRLEAPSPRIEGPFGAWTFTHPSLRWPEDGTAFVEAALHAAALEVAWIRGGLLCHGAGLAAGANALLALADSGGGKSTLTTLAHPRCASLSDETVHLELGEPITLAATSFRSDAPIAPVCASAALRALLVLEKSEVPRATELAPAAAAGALMAQLYRPRQASMAELLHRASKVVRGVPAFRFAFPKNAAAVELLDEVLRSRG